MTSGNSPACTTVQKDFISEKMESNWNKHSSHDSSNSSNSSNDSLVFLGIWILLIIPFIGLCIPNFWPKKRPGHKYLGKKDKVHENPRCSQIVHFSATSQTDPPSPAQKLDGWIPIVQNPRPQLFWKKYGSHKESQKNCFFSILKSIFEYYPLVI